MAQATIQRIINSLFAIYFFTVGRRMYAMYEVKRRAEELGLTAVVEHATRCLEHDQGVYRLEGRYKRARAAQYGPTARAQDIVVDRILVFIDGYLGGQVEIFGEDHPRGRAAATLRRRFFPETATAVIRLPFTEEHMHVTQILKAVEAEAEVADAVSVLNDLQVMLAELRAANSAYGAALSSDRERPSSNDMRAVRDQGQRLMSEVIALIVGHFAINAPDDAEGLSYLLEPIKAQQSALAVIHRRRRRVVDVDPDTGVELPDDDAPTDDVPPSEDLSEGEAPADELPEGDDPAGDGDEAPVDDDTSVDPAA